MCWSATKLSVTDGTSLEEQDFTAVNQLVGIFAGAGASALTCASVFALVVCLAVTPGGSFVFLLFGASIAVDALARTVDLSDRH